MATSIKYDEGKVIDIQAWCMDVSLEDQRLPHYLEPKVFVSLEQLEEMGVFIWKLKAEDKIDQNLRSFCDAKGYTPQAFVVEVSPEKVPNYEVAIKKFYREHCHDAVEAIYVAEGRGYYDVRDRTDSWIRILIEKGYIIALSTGLYHRFSPDTTNFMKVNRIFPGNDSSITTLYRPIDDLPVLSH